MWWLLFACTGSTTVLPSGPAPLDLPAEPAWARVSELDGVERLFTGPFRCSLPDGTDAFFFPNKVLRAEPDLRGRWSHADRTLRAEARVFGVEVRWEWPYTPYTAGGPWWLATPEGVLSCRPGHERAPEPGGTWVRVRSAGGDVDSVGRVLGSMDLPLVVLGDDAPPGRGIEVVYAGAEPPSALIQALADGLQRPVRPVAGGTGAPLEVRVGP